VTPKQRDIMKHALGVGRGNKTGWRNHFVTGPGSDDYADCEALVEADKVLGTIDGESQEEWDMLLQLRRCITAATMPHRPEDADLLSIRERLGC